LKVKRLCAAVGATAVFDPKRKINLCDEVLCWSMIRTPPAKSGQSLKRCAMRARSNETRRSHHHEVRADNT